ncbi:MAG: A/G-specific adenine glycosylase [Thiomicrorhabdus sp.]|nr:MAG: A/G-specific adenine glycosylase [Thiomicrorhabdus sp.]
MSQFSKKLLEWFDQHGRHDLPWQQQINPYRVWVSEIMLQQTQVKTVIPYYERFMASFPTVKDLAQASQDAVLGHWAGLGYYARGRNLHKSACIIANEFNGIFPTSFDDILALPGIGRSTAGAILSIALEQRYAILDGNVKRVLSRHLALEGWPSRKDNELILWQEAEERTPQNRFNDYTQAIMDLGATICTRSKPKCEACPVASECQAKLVDRVKDFPVSKPKKPKSIKKAFFLILENEQGGVLLQKRPQKGIWGGLWSFPEFECRESCLEGLKSLETQTNAEHSLIEWDSFRHTFTHYHLDIFPMYCSSIGDQKNLSEGVWVPKQQLCSAELGLGVPAPVTKLATIMESLDV